MKVLIYMVEHRCYHLQLISEVEVIDNVDSWDGEEIIDHIIQLFLGER